MFLRYLDRIDIKVILEPPLVFGYQDIITTHLPFAHLSIFGERPVLQAIAPLPLHTIVCVLILIPELNSNLVVAECKELLSQTVALFFLPLSGQELDYGFATGQKLVPVSPYTIRGISLGDGLRFSADGQPYYTAMQQGRMGSCTVRSRDLELS